MNKRILVLGATGMLGEPVARHLQERSRRCYRREQSGKGDG
jgi:nucleoside-diphosphate-sugar epimerase